MATTLSGCSYLRMVEQLLSRFPTRLFTHIIANSLVGFGGTILPANLVRPSNVIQVARLSPLLPGRIYKSEKWLHGANTIIISRIWAYRNYSPL